MLPTIIPTRNASGRYLSHDARERLAHLASIAMIASESNLPTCLEYVRRNVESILGRSV